MSLSKSQKKIIDIALARKGRYKNMVLSEALGLEIISLSQETSAGGNAEEVFSISGILDGDFVFSSLVDKGSNSVTIVDSKVSSSGEVTVEFSADPGADAVVNLLIIRKSSEEEIY